MTKKPLRRRVQMAITNVLFSMMRAVNPAREHNPYEEAARNNKCALLAAGLHRWPKSLAARTPVEQWDERAWQQALAYAGIKSASPTTRARFIEVMKSIPVEPKAVA